MITPESHPHLFIVYEIKCRFCNKVVGIQQLPKNFWGAKIISNETLGIADIRCEDHENQYGKYTDMEKIYLEKTHKPDFEQFIKICEFKKSKFDEELEKLNGI